MGQFNKYGREADAIAREAFREYKAAEDKYNKAHEAVKLYPERGGMVSADYAAKAARARADMIEAQNEYNQAIERLRSRCDDIKGVRNRLVADVADHYAADPSKMDSNTVELLRSGILKADEYKRLMNKAKADGNNTMARVIGKYAMSAADADEKENGEDSRTARELRAVSYLGNQDSSDAVIQTFDVIQEAYTRTANNPAMLDAWDELTHNAIENL